MNLNGKNTLIHTNVCNIKYPHQFINYKWGKEELKLINNIELVLKRVWRGHNMAPHYVFKLCCKKIAKLYNPCPGEDIGLTLPKCVNVFDTIFSIESIIFDNQVVNVDERSSNAYVHQSNGNYLISLPSDSVEHVNTICINEICIYVTADCLDLSLLGKCANLDEFVTPVCRQDSLGECWLKIINHGTDNSFLADDIIPADLDLEIGTGDFKSPLDANIATLTEELVSTCALNNNNKNLLDGTFFIYIILNPEPRWRNLISLLDTQVIYRSTQEDFDAEFDEENMIQAFACYKEKYKL